MIGIGYGKQTLLKILFFVFVTGTERYHSIVFQKFAADRTAADHKELSVLNLFEQISSDDRSNTIRSKFFRLNVKRGDKLLPFFLFFWKVWQNLATIRIEEL